MNISRANSGTIFVLICVFSCFWALGSLKAQITIDPYHAFDANEAEEFVALFGAPNSVSTGSGKADEPNPGNYSITSYQSGTSDGPSGTASTTFNTVFSSDPTTINYTVESAEDVAIASPGMAAEADAIYDGDLDFSTTAPLSISASVDTNNPGSRLELFEFVDTSIDLFYIHGNGSTDLILPPGNYVLDYESDATVDSGSKVGVTSQAYTYNFTFNAAAVPEPSVFMLALWGVGCLALVRQVRRFSYLLRPKH